MATPTLRRRARRQRALARHLWHQHVKGFRTLSWRQLASIKTRLQAHHSRDRVWLRRISTTMWKKAKDPWRCLNCSKLNRYSIHCCGDWGGHWEDFMDHTYVPPSQQQQQKQAQSSSAQPPQWESSRRSYSTWTQNETWQNQDWDDWEQSSTSSRSSSAKKIIYTAGEATTKTSCATQSTGSKAKRAKGRMPSSHRLGRPAPSNPRHLRLPHRVNPVRRSSCRRLSPFSRRRTIRSCRRLQSRPMS